MMKENEINKAEDWTHSKEFEKEFTNENIRRMLKEIMDLAEGLTNYYSGKFDREFISPDIQKIGKRLSRIEKILDNAPVKRR